MSGRAEYMWMLAFFIISTLCVIGQSEVFHQGDTITDGLPFPFPAESSSYGDDTHGRLDEVSMIDLVEKVKSLNPLRDPSSAGEVCALLHGTGIRGGGKTEPQKSFWLNKQKRNSLQNSKATHAQNMRDYWGDLPRFLKEFKACREVVVAAIESRSRTWDNSTIIADYCNILNLEPKPTVVFTHSMGNVVIAAGIGWQFPGCDRLVKRNDLEGLRKGGAAWFGSQGPMIGTVASNMCLHVCAGEYDHIGHIIEKFKINMARKNCGCGQDPQNPKYPFPATRSCAPFYNSAIVRNGIMIQFLKTSKDGVELHVVPSGVTLKLHSEISSEYMWGNMCGVTGNSIVWRPFHKHSYLQVLSSFVQKYAGKGGWGPDFDTVIDEKHNKFAGNDGFIAFSSCSGLDRSFFRSDSASPFYVLNGNHADGTGRIIDNYDYKSRQPRVWYLLRVRQITNLRANAHPNVSHPHIEMDLIPAEHPKPSHTPAPSHPPVITSRDEHARRHSVAHSDENSSQSLPILNNNDDNNNNDHDKTVKRSKRLAARRMEVPKALAREPVDVSLERKKQEEEEQLEDLTDTEDDESDGFLF